MLACKSLKQLALIVIAAGFCSDASAQHQGSFLYPHIDIGLTRNYNANGISLGEINAPGYFMKPALDIGYMFTPQYGLITGIGYSKYRYLVRMVYSGRVNATNNINDTVVTQQQQFVSVPLAIKLYLGKETKRPVLTGYLETGFVADVLVAASFKATGKIRSGANRDDFFPLLLKVFLKMGADIPLEGRTTLLLAFTTGVNLTENNRQDARVIHGQGISLPVYGLDLGCRVQL